MALANVASDSEHFLRVNNFADDLMEVMSDISTAVEGSCDEFVESLGDAGEGLCGLCVGNCLNWVRLKGCVKSPRSLGSLGNRS